MLAQVHLHPEHPCLLYVYNESPPSYCDSQFPGGWQFTIHGKGCDWHPGDGADGYTMDYEFVELSEGSCILWSSPRTSG